MGDHESTCLTHGMAGTGGVDGMRAFGRASDLVFRKLRHAIRTITRPNRVTLAGCTIDFSLVPMSNDMKHVFWSEVYERPERKIVADYIRDDDTVLEIGAGLGLISTLCAKRVGGERVHAFEANPAMEAAIRANYAANQVCPNLTIACIGARDGLRELHIGNDFWSTSALEVPDTKATCEVPEICFQHLLDTIRPTFLIIDVEGYEQVLLKNARLDGVERICLELHPRIIGHPSCTEILMEICAQGFALNLLESEKDVVLLERNGAAADADTATPRHDN